MGNATDRTSRRTVARILGLCLVLTIAMTTGSPVSAADPTPGAGDAAVRPPHIEAFLDAVAVHSPSYDRVAARLQDIEGRLGTETALLTQATKQLADLQRQRVSLTRRIDRDHKVKAAAEAAMATLRVELRHLALAAYVGASDGAARYAALTLDSAGFLRARTRSDLRSAATRESHGHYVHESAIAHRAARRLTSNHAALARNLDETDRANRQHDDAQRAIAADKRAVIATTQQVHQARATAFVDGTDLPLVVLDAYVHAARMAAMRDRACHLDWTLLAGIGEVESGQGTSGGASVRADGTLTKPITGIPLDGSHATQQIRTADGGFMHAQGPMQFLPSTWQRTAVDGDGDGKADIGNFYDAAATAGAYLCRNGVDVSTPDGRRAAILSYNASDAYVAKVTAAMKRYAEALPRLPTS